VELRLLVSASVHSIGLTVHLLYRDGDPHLR
jgi:hypothetical protein